jgi:3-hydroxyisobutyrate dehydrogenase-like beta-hydroxyacid dehydrogenase
MAKIGFIGLGVMASPMMNRLLLGALMAERTAPTEAKVWRDSTLYASTV